MKRLVFLLIIGIILGSLPVNPFDAPGGEDNSSPPSSGGGGGGPQYYDYLIPLVFNNSHPDGESEVSIWLFQQTVIYTSFILDEFGSTAMRIYYPTKLTFSPSVNTGLTNGSLIRVLQIPAQVVGHRSTEDVYSDNSFSYTVLPNRMLGFEFISPLSGIISVIGLQAGTEVVITHPDEEYGTSSFIFDPSDPLVLNVVEGSIIVSTYPITGAFYHSSSLGTYTTLAVPSYFFGRTYIFDGELNAPNFNEYDRSYIGINPSESTEIRFIFSNRSYVDSIIFGPTHIKLDRDLVGIHAKRGELEVHIRQQVDYGGLTRISSVQLFSAENMFAAQLFIIPTEFSSHYGVIQANTSYNRGYFDELINNYAYVSPWTYNA
ncbi:MAG: hypothetical protein OEY49_15175, partial [Candidatus Heimdallarchaeota archaeon]|nr:hypothetical protein [Candidatus Heimdallarchaeota archaeon]